MRSNVTRGGHGQQLLAAVFVGAHDHQDALLFLSHARFEVDAVRPDVEEPARAEVALLPGPVVFPPVRFQPRDGLGRKALGIGPQQGRQRLAEIARGHALEVEPGRSAFPSDRWQEMPHLLDRFRAAQVARQDPGREGDPVLARLAVPHARHLHGHRADPGQDLALRKMTMAHQPGPSVLELMVGEGRQQRGQFRLDCLLDQLARAVPDDLGQRVRRKSQWIGQMGDGIVRHVAYPVLG